MPKPDKIYKDPEGWVAKLGCAVIIAAVVSGAAFFGLLIWGVVELIQLIGRLG